MFLIALVHSLLPKEFKSSTPFIHSLYAVSFNRVHRPAKRGKFAKVWLWQ